MKSFVVYANKAKFPSLRANFWRIRTRLAASNFHCETSTRWAVLDGATSAAISADDAAGEACWRGRGKGGGGGGGRLAKSVAQCVPLDRRRCGRWHRASFAVSSTVCVQSSDVVACVDARPISVPKFSPANRHEAVSERRLSTLLVFCPHYKEKNFISSFLTNILR